VVVNHPFGGIEGIIPAEVLLQIRPDVRILGNYLLTRIPVIWAYLLKTVELRCSNRHWRIDDYRSSKYTAASHS